MHRFLFILSSLWLTANAPAVEVTLDPHQPGRTFEGIGAVSAGASSRLLVDYPEPQRSQILDYLFKPDYGAALQHLKVEIGGEVNSTDGTEPTHMRTRTDRNYTRGYEWWLVQQAKARNPAIMLDCLAWGAPGWIGNSNYCSQDMCDYIVDFLKGAQVHHGLTFDFTGTRNEAAVNAAWIKQLRTSLDANGLQRIQLVAADEWGGAWNIVTNSGYGILVDPALSNAVARIGAHYPHSSSPAVSQSCSQPLWSSEDGIGGSEWLGARKLGKLLNRNYVTGRMTKTEIWSPITSYYDILPAANSGLMRANTPWSGNYEVAPAIWVAAHTAQFAFPGWTYLAGGACSLLPAGGSIVMLESTNHSDYSIVIETFDATSAQTITFHLTNGLSPAPLALWQTSRTNQFVRVGEIIPLSGSFTCTVQPECIYTLTTTRGQAKGAAAPPPAAPFPLPFREDFESYAPGRTPKFFSDQAGTFETEARADGRGQCLRQVLRQMGIRWAAEWQPYSLIGEAAWTDYEVSADVLIETNGGSAFVMGRVETVPGFSDALPRGYWLELNNATAQWKLHASSNLLAAGSARVPANSWHNLRLAMQGNSLRCYVDGLVVSNVTDSAYSHGLAGIGCGWHGAQFDNFALVALRHGRLDLAPAATPQAQLTIPEGFQPVHYRPIPTEVAGLKHNVLSLDGAWQIDPKPGLDAREKPLAAGNWGIFRVPGQWQQQGYEIPRTNAAALAREFTIPATWAGHRIFLRFDAIHGGTHYWLNGQALGYSENLFTPVEWEITAAAKVGQTNRLDLEMKVATASERLSPMSDYVSSKCSLGGIDRAVRIFALPGVHIASLHLNAGLDGAYRDGELEIELGFDNPEPAPVAGLNVAIQLFDARGKAVAHSTPAIAPETLKPGSSRMSIKARVAAPLKWNAEQPNLYKLVLVLKQGGRTLEQIERNIGFRTVEVKDRQLYVNGAPVKLAGVCRHEIDPLTGRADTMRHGEDDVRLFKLANLNHVRTAHYPCTQEFLDAADRYGLYVEPEAPFAFVAPAKGLTDLNAVLTPTSAMIDYDHWHPSVIIWSLANESHWSDLFAASDKLCKQLDPTRPTTFNHAFSKEKAVTCDILNRHYQALPYDEIFKNDSRPFLHGECFFVVYHERTEVAINPGLRELWAHGSADTASDWGRACSQNWEAQKFLWGSQDVRPGIYPGAWNYIYASRQCIGSEIWSGVDDIILLPDGKVLSSENGNAYWGLIDGWRRPKPELFLSKFVFSPVWFPVRQLDYQPGQRTARVPVENRYSFTDLSQRDFLWETGGRKGTIRLSLAPGAKGELEIPVRKGTPEGSTLLVRVMQGRSEIVNAALSLGKRQPAPLPRPQAGAPSWNDDGRFITLQGHGFSLVLDRTTGDLTAANPKHRAPIASFPALHVTRHDFNDLAGYTKARKKLPYAELPDAGTRVIESVTVAENSGGIELTVKDRYTNFVGAVHWLIDREGVGRMSYDYTYSGPDLDTREIGLKMLLHPRYDEVKWRRWSEWGVFPADSISRTEGSARARRDRRWHDTPANVRPAWPWSLDQTELGTADFRAIKFNIYHASLLASDGSGVRVDANGDVHFRACLATNGVKMHILSQCPLVQAVLKDGDRLAGEYSVRLLP